MDDDGRKEKTWEVMPSTDESTSEEATSVSSTAHIFTDILGSMAMGRSEIDVGGAVLSRDEDTHFSEAGCRSIAPHERSAGGSEDDDDDDNEGRGATPSFSRTLRIPLERSGKALPASTVHAEAPSGGAEEKSSWG